MINQHIFAFIIRQRHLPAVFICHCKLRWRKAYFNILQYKQLLVKYLSKIWILNLWSKLCQTLYLSCLSMFSHKKELIPLLFNSISTVSGKVERLISFDIAKRWYLRDIAERMYTSESLIKKKLQDENTCFSKILLASRMSMARRLLELRQIPLHTIAEKCGYSSTSYFINTFRQ